MPFVSSGHIWLLLILLVVVLIIWGPGKLPDVGSGLGRAMREFRKASNDTREEFARATRPDGEGSAAAPAPSVATAPAPSVATAPVAPVAAAAPVAPAPIPVSEYPPAPAAPGAAVAAANGTPNENDRA